ncbi:MAG: NfeD family protein [Lachnospiraceae bacterium]|nr:NfeD family protein [Lachnospiraceae bacterium]MBR1450517.1 NfeD family protein [Lachnospiraceae bacterium]
MTPMVWLIILIICLVIEFVRIELIGACGAGGALVGLVLNILGFNPFLQIAAAVAVAVFLFIVVRPVGMKYIMRARREKQLMELEGRDAIVTVRIDNTNDSGVVRIGNKNWSARSNRPNGIIDEGEVVTVVAMRGNVAYVDRKR